MRTWELEIDEGGGQLGAGVGEGVAGDVLGGETVEGAAEGAGPRPLLQLTEGIEVGPAVLAAGELVPIRAVDGRVSELIRR